MDTPQLLPLGPDGVLVRFSETLEDAANRAALAFRSVVDQAGLHGVTETASSLTSVYVRFRPDQVSRSDLNDALGQCLDGTDWQGAPLPSGRTLWHIPAVFGGDEGPGLEEAAILAGVSADQAIRDVTNASLRVLALGFAPGQPYLGFLPQHWDIPRQTDVNPQVPQGAVVVAVRQVIPFSNAAPTGWRQIGWTAFRCYTPSMQPALPLKPGDEIRFAQINGSELTKLKDDPRGGAEAEALP